MSDIKNIEQHYSLDERPFLEKVRGFCQLVEDRYSPYLTDFLNPREIQIVKDLANYYNLKFFVSSTFDNEEYGRVILAPDYYELDEDDFETGLNYAARHQEPMQQCEYLQREQLEQVNPQIAVQFRHAIYFPQIANVRNPRLLQSLTAYLKQHPLVQFIEHCPVAQLQIQHRRIQSIQTADGARHSADQYVLATGAWSAHWATQLQLDIPVQPIQGQMVLFKAPAHWLPTMCMNKVMYLIPRADGHIVCGSSTLQAGFNTAPDAAVQRSILQACFEMVPELANFPIEKQWAGLRPSSPDGIPYIGKMPEITNLWAN